MRSRFAVIGALFNLLALSSATGQSSAWPSVHQTNGWYGSIFETMFGRSRFGLLTDIQLRRMGLTEQPKQLDAVVGLSYRPTNGLRFTLGGEFVSSTPYGSLPAPFPTREHLLWYQMNLQQHVAQFDFGQRFRYENRWIHDVITDGDGKHDSDVRFSHRVRYQVRASHPVKSMQMHNQPLLLIGAEEVFIGLTPVDRRVAFDQNRASVGVGLPLSRGERLEVSYMQQWIANTKYKTTEINNTLLVMFVHNYK
ncbi:MAG: DUF2490 domain-containing protein [Gemmatimonadaceae bacterium]